jgi:hypothetical protein
MAEASTEGTRVALADLLGMPVDDVLHYAVVVHHRGGMLAHRFCGMPRDGIMLHAAAVQSLAWGQVDLEAAKLAAGCTACGDKAPEK